MPADLSAIRIVQQCDRWVVIDKPAGVLSVPGKGAAHQACAASWVRARFPQARGSLTVHRLDMDTSGLLLLALDPEAHRELSRQFEARRVGKRYIAIVGGSVPVEQGEIVAPLRADIDRRPRQVVDYELGRPALTRYRVLQRAPERTRLELIPETGRTHQLRVHCALPGPLGLAGPAAAAADPGRPILGDVLYGDAASAPRLMLHAQVLTFSDPTDGRELTVESPPPF